MGEKLEINKIVDGRPALVPIVPHVIQFSRIEYVDKKIEYWNTETRV